MKEFLKSLIPPIFLALYHQFFTKNNSLTTWKGDYKSWKEAQKDCKGSYEENNILETCKNSLLKVKNGEAVYERDGVLFDKKVYYWPLLAYLQKIAFENNNQLNILDFGGSLGSTYFQNRDFFGEQVKIEWNIVEQRNFVDTGKVHFENEELKFYYDVESCLAEQKVEVVILSSVLQYLEDPLEWIKKFNNLGIKHIFIDRTAVIDQEEDLLTIQKTSEEIYSAQYPAWFFGKHRIEKIFENYKVMFEDESSITQPIYLGEKRCSWKFYYLEKK